MEPLHIAESNETPTINLDKAAGLFEFTGRSLHDNPSAFYKLSISWLSEYAKSPNTETDLAFKFEYLNTESAKSILDILTVMEGVDGVKVSWYFNEEDEDMEEIGEEIAELVQIPFEFVPYR